MKVKSFGNAYIRHRIDGEDMGTVIHRESQNEEDIL
jgi:hypothetical protein